MLGDEWPTLPRRSPATSAVPSRLWARSLDPGAALIVVMVWRSPLENPACIPVPPAHELAAPTKPRQLVCAGNHAPALMQQLAKFKQVAPAEAWCSPPATLGLEGSHLRYDLLAAVSACPMCASTSQLIVGATGVIA